MESSRNGISFNPVGVSIKPIIPVWKCVILSWFRKFIYSANFGRYSMKLFKTDQQLPRLYLNAALYNITQIRKQIFITVSNTKNNSCIRLHFFLKFL